MEVEEIQNQGHKLPRITNNGRSDFIKIGQNRDDQYPEEEEGGEVKNGITEIPDVDGGGSVGRLCGWSSSRIVRVSRGSGGKDRHSKVLTSKGPRDRRVRLSVTTAIQFYDLQDRLGYDQPSKAVEWLLKAAAKSIDELPSLNTSLFPETPKQICRQTKTLDSTENHQQQKNHVSPSRERSACSSTSETSRGSGSLSLLSRCESRLKPWERARERRADREKEKEEASNHVSPNAQNSFTDLLNSGINHTNRGALQFSSAPMEYFLSPPRIHQFSEQIQSGNAQIPPFIVAGDHHHQELQQFSFIPDHLIPAAANGGGLAGFGRGTLQSNSQSLLPHIQKLFHVDHGSSVPFFMGTAAPNSAALENHHHQFPAGFDGRVQRCYGGGGGGGRSSDQKGGGKS